MLNTERIRLMTQLAAYEQGEGKEYMAMSRYYRRDYLVLQMIKTFLCSTVAFAVLFLLSVLYRVEEWMQEIYQRDYTEYITGIVVKYILFVVFYQIVAYIVYGLRYRRGHKKQKQYHNKLKKMEKLYEQTGGQI